MFDLFEFCPQLVVQKYIPGDDSHVYFCLELFDRDNKEIGYFSGRKILQWPPLKGSTAIAVAERNETIHKMTREIFEKLRLQRPWIYRIQEKSPGSKILHHRADRWTKRSAIEPVCCGGHKSFVDDCEGYYPRIKRKHYTATMAEAIRNRCG